MMVSNIVMLSVLLSNAWAIENVSIWDGAGQAFDKSHVLVEGGKIRSVGGPIPEGTTRIDGKGGILTPGFIEAFSQLGLTEVGAVKNTNDYVWRDREFTPALDVLKAFNPKSIRIPTERRQGVTRVMLAPRSGVLSGTGAMVCLNGNLRDLPLDKARTALFGRVNGRSANGVGGSRAILWLELEEIFSDAKLLKAKGRLHEGRNLRDLSLRADQLEALFPLLERRVPLVLEVNRAVDILRALDFSQKWNLKMVIKGGAESWLVATELAEMKVPVIVRPGQQGPWDFDSISSRDDLPKLLQDAGVPLIISAFGYFQNAGRLRQEAAFGIRAGLTKAEALTAISWRPAQLFSGEAYVGRIAKGADADLVLWNGDPFELNHSVERMWIRGEKQSLEDRALLLAKRYYGKLKVFHELPMALE